MRIRWKLLFVLIVAAVAPLLFMAWWGQRSVSRMGRDLAERSREMLTLRAEELLSQLVTSNGELVGREGQTIRILLRQQARAVERLLASEIEPGADRERVWFAREFETEGEQPPGLTLDDRYARSGDDPPPVSRETQSVWLAPGTDLTEIEPDLARLQPLTEFYKRVNEGNPDLIYWQYTALENGLHTVFPGHGEYPSTFDPRKRPWYRFTKELGAFSWSVPLVDAASGRVVLTATMPVRYPDGSFAGVTAIDLLITEIIGLVDVPTKWEGGAEVLIVGYPPERMPDGVDEPLMAPLTVLARREYAEQGGDWNTPPETIVLSSADQQQIDALLADLRAGRSGVRRLPYQGEDALWAYSRGRISSGGLIIIVPTALVTADARSAQQFVLGRTRRHIVVAVSLAAAVLLATAVVAFLVARTFTRPIEKLSETAQLLAEGDFEARADIDTGDEFGHLAKVLNHVGPRLRDQVRLRQSLELAREVQQHLLPHACPQVEGVDLAGRSIYCDETGGDYYDFIELPQAGPGRLAVAVGDVTGHGIAAALLMTTARALLHSHADDDTSLSDLFNRTNEHLARDAYEGRFMTLYYASIDPGANSLRWVSAGHDPAIVYDPDADEFSDLSGEDIPLGVDAGWRFNESERAGLPGGAVILIGTDGIWESRNPIGEMFGKDRLRALIRRNAGEPAEQICNAITDSLVAFREGRPQEDDVTLVVVKLSRA